MTTAERLYEEAMELPEQERHELAWRLWTALAPIPGPDAITGELLDRRDQELAAGTKRGVTLEESVARARRIVSARSPL